MKRVLVAGALLVPSLASAHIHLLTPLSRTDTALGDPQKTAHCGTATWDRAANAARVQTFAPGATINVTWAETVNHSGWYRIAFKPDGEVFPLPPAGTGAAAGNVPSNFPSVSQEGMMVDGAYILADFIPDGTTSKQVTLPNIECANCTLQFIQVMNDAAGYDPADLYFNCADLVLGASAPDAGPGATVDAGVTGDAPAGGGGTDAVEGGCAVGGGSSGGGLGVGLGLALLGVRRRRSAVV